MFFFLRPASSLDVAMNPQLNHIQYDQKHFIHNFKSKHFLVQDSGKKINRQLAALGFTPRHEVLQELLVVEHCRPLPRTRTKKPIATSGRREDYVRLPFVDDLCLRTAMQGFLRRKLSSKAKLTRRQTKSSKCQRCLARVSSPAISVASEKLSTTCEVFT